MRIYQTIALAIAIGTLTGCGGMMAGVMGPQRAENGMPMAEYEFRSELAAGRADSLLLSLKGEDADLPDDELLGGLYVGIAASYAGDYEISQNALQLAADLAEDRYTESVSEGIASLLTSDNALGYEPGQTERLFIHYYGIMNFAEQGDAAGAAIEARRIGNLLERFDENQDTVDVATRAALRYIAGAAFEAAGERNDADVSYRNAFALLGEQASSQLPEVAEPSEGEGTLVVVVEHGFVAHRVETPLVVALSGDEHEAFRGTEAADKAKTIAAVAARVALGLASEPGAALYWGGPEYKIDAGNLSTAAYLLKLSWPTYYPTESLDAECSIALENGTAPVYMTANVSDAAIGDFRRARAGILARTIARASVKMLAAEEIGKRTGTWGKVLANVGAGLLERADTRSWHMLPNELGVARVNLPAGPQSGVRLRIASANGIPQELDLGDITVPDRGTTLVRVRTY